MTIAKRPSLWDGMVGDILLIWVNREAEYFWSLDWTGQIRLIRLDNFADRCKSEKWDYEPPDPRTITSRRRQPHVKPAAGCLGVAQQRLGARKRVTVFKPGDGGLADAYPGREFGLREARAQAGPEQLGGNLELRRERADRPVTTGVLSMTEKPVVLFILEGRPVYPSLICFLWHDNLDASAKGTVSASFLRRRSTRFFEARFSRSTRRSEPWAEYR